MYGLEELKFLEVLFGEVIVDKVEFVYFFVLLKCLCVMFSWDGV